VFCNSKIVFLAIKPQYFFKVASGLSVSTLGLPLNILISIMAGIPLGALQEVSHLIKFF
jgi:pyrroline-5-carboxylate reductase